MKGQTTQPILLNPSSYSEGYGNLWLSMNSHTAHSGQLKIVLHVVWSRKLSILGEMPDVLTLLRVSP